MANYEDSTYVFNYVCAANELMVTDAGEVDGYGKPYISYTGGKVMIYSTIYDIVGSELLMELGTINYIFVNSNGIVTTNTTGWPNVCVPMAEVVCDETGILSISNERTTLNTRYGDLSVVSGRRIYLEGFNSDTYFTYNSTTGNVELWKNGVIAATW